jgi:exodeoxyribonuclease-3
LILYSWNVNGLRALHKKGFLDWFQQTQPDILCLQETKCHPDQLPAALRQPEGYHSYWASAVKKGYSGVALYTRRQPLSVQVGLGIERFDNEGRTLVADYGRFTLINAYFPSGSSGQARIQFKLDYYAAFLDFCNQLQAAGKPIIFCGDVNTAHHPIDLARPTQNKKTSGFLPQERAWMDEVVAAGYVDAFRAQYPDTSDAYSWWTVRSGARERNVGWRLDYFFVSQSLYPHVTDAIIHPDVPGSDHCPVSLVISNQ